ncbi:anti-phage ZorAB system protein ZorA [Haemophilus paraphrohaemolyticus]|uniref:MotA/TolQ/ExbB proton channel domain-containing protein n=1 Tax=Haemophilus paraphrohaemolyticus HK411 TaxID=1095743 RepID=I2ND98_9PAST|nr:anti-phage ZorAB system protein ZorA [Haemophilus paraphrohaemolyticus]EIG23809.1 hypothetical protein HMPREF1054_0662 [Haemophilus paraphrohaemolyticus HK411]OOR94768.1 hypothetical protein B0184_07155 [Haemophilus paraphrohaemolyticus]STP01587.1 Uncharacterised protein [Haemophilus paraphrohaemolyticus]
MDALLAFFSKFFPGLPYSINPQTGEWIIDQSAQSNLLTLIILIILVICFFIYWCKVQSQYKDSVKGIQFYEKYITGVEQDKEQNQLAEKRRELLEQAKESKKFGAIWQEFNESLVEVEITKDKRKLYNTADAAYFFNNHTLAGGLTENRLFSAVPGFLTAIGVLGTFLGLTFGLGGLSEHFKEGATPKEIMEGINLMVSGASTAFITSLYGVITSLIFNWKEKALERKVKNRITKLQVRIDAIFPRIVAEQTLTEIKAINRDTETHLASLSEKIGEQMQKVMKDISSEISRSITDSLKESLAPAVTNMMENSREGSEKMVEVLLQEFISKIGNAGEMQKNAMNNASQAFAESSTQMMSRLSIFVEQLDAKVTEVRDGTRQMLEQMQQHFSTQIGDMQSQTQQQNEQAVEFMQTLSSSMIEFNQHNQSMFSSMQTMLSEKAEEQSLQFAKREQDLTVSTNNFMEKLTQAIETLNNNNSQMLKAMESGLTERINTQAEADKARSEDFIQQAEKGRQTQQILTDSVKEVLATQGKQNDELSLQLTTLANSFERVAQAHKASSESMENASAKINSSATGFDNVATRLKAALTEFDTKLATMLINVEKVTRENSNTATLFNASTSRLETSGVFLEKTADNLSDTAHTTKAAFESMQTNFNQFALQLRTHIEALNAEVSKLLVDYSKQVQSQTNNRLNEWNNQTREYTTNMVNAVKALSDTVDEIETKLPHRGA